MKTTIGILLIALILFSACIDDGEVTPTTTTEGQRQLSPAEKVCDMLSDEDKKTECFAVVNKDASICEDMTLDKADYCYWNLGIELSDTSLCDKSSNELFKANCYGGIADDSSVCEQFSDEDAKDNCYYQISQRKEDDSLCEKIKIGPMISECYSAIAILRKDIALCDNIKGEENDLYKKACYVLVIDEISDTLTADFCQGISEDVRGFCYATVATETGNCDLCEEAKKYPHTLFLDEQVVEEDIDEEGDEDEDYEEVEEDTLFCEEYCAIGKAKIAKDATLCESMEYMFAETCYIELAILLKDETLCERAGTYASFCYEELAVEKDDTSICDKNTDEIETEICYWAVAQKVAGTKKFYVY